MTRQLSFLPLTADEDGDQLDLIEAVAEATAEEIAEGRQEIIEDNIAGALMTVAPITSAYRVVAPGSATGRSVGVLIQDFDGSWDAHDGDLRTVSEDTDLDGALDALAAHLGLDVESLELA